MALARYNQKRNFKKTPEPAGKTAPRHKQLLFVVQKHNASHLHYDFRLEMDGVLKSWSVPKGPSMDPSVKRLAVEVEDHPWSYRDFEGSIPEGNYGAGDVIVWDTGPYESADDSAHSEAALLRGLKEGRLSFVMRGKKLKGEFSLVRTKFGGRSSSKPQWLLMKKDDEFATKDDVLEDARSAISDRSLITDDEKEEGLKRVGGGGIPKSAKKSGAKKKRARAAKTKRARFSAKDLSPMLATLADAPFDDPDWIYEVKWDGYRIIAASSVKKSGKGEALLVTRRGVDASEDYPALTQAIASIGRDAILDGELVALDARGRTRFQLLQQARKTENTRLAYYAFDLLMVDGEDLRALPLIERKEKLEELISSLPKDARAIIRYSEHIVGEGEKYFRAAEKEGLEGIMAKRASSLYRSGTRSVDWLKVKTAKRQEAVIVGYTDPKGSRQHFGSLLLAMHEGSGKGGKFVYAGRAGTGFNGALLKELLAKMKPLEVKTKPITEKVPEESHAHWLKPELVCEVKFEEWTDDNQMRQPVYLGLRADKKATDVVREREEDAGALHEQANEKEAKPREKTARAASASSEVNLTNLDKVLWPKEGYTKGDLIEHYRSVAPYILPYLKDRPESLHRFPNGINKPGFYQKNVDPKTLPNFVSTETVHSDSTGEDVHYVVCDNEQTLLYLANLGCIELNPWSSRRSSLEKPDWYVIDLDPGDDNTFEDVIQVARVVHEVLDEACEQSFVKTSGKTGLHICVPLGAKYHYERVVEFAKLVASVANARLPKLTSMERNPRVRKGKVYLDYLQNNVGQTIAAPYSLRPIEGALVSTPLEWKEVKKGLSPTDFTIKNIGARLKKKGDLWKGILAKGVDLEDSITCLNKALKKAVK